MFRCSQIIINTTLQKLTSNLLLYKKPLKAIVASEKVNLDQSDCRKICSHLEIYSYFCFDEII